MRVASVRPRTAGVMKTLMRNGRDRRSENPLLGHAKIERVLLIGTDQRITSGPAAKRPHPKAEYMTAPERFADGQIPLAPRRARSRQLPNAQIAQYRQTSLSLCACRANVSKRCELRGRRILSVRPYGTAQSSRNQRERRQAGGSLDSRQRRPLALVPCW